MRISDWSSDVCSSDLVKWTIAQIAAEKSTAFFRKEMQDIVAVETPDDRTVRLVTRTPNVTIPRLMASYHLPIISRASAGGEPVGAGPFKIKETERGVALDLEAFDAFSKKQEKPT